MPIKYKIVGKLKAAGWSTYRVRKEKLLSEATLQAIREERPINTDTIDRLCEVLKCQPSDLLEYVPEAEQDDVR